MQRGKAWSPQEIEEARAYRKSGLNFKEIGKIMSRGRKSVARALGGEEPPVVVHDVAPNERFVPPADALAEREYRLGLLPRDVTALICGDPMPGYSALERKVA